MSEGTQVLTFLADHVIGKTLIADPIKTCTDRGRIEGVYEDQSIYHNLIETSGDQFRFDLTTLTTGSLHEVDKGAARQQSEVSLNAIRILRYEMTERKSSGKLVGFARFLSSTNAQPDPFSGTIFLVRMSMEGQDLLVQESQIGYADVAGVDGSVRSIASDGQYRYAVKNGKLETSYQQTRFDVNPETLERNRLATSSQVKLAKNLGRHRRDPSLGVGQRCGMRMRPAKLEAGNRSARQRGPIMNSPTTGSANSLVLQRLAKSSVGLPPPSAQGASPRYSATRYSVWNRQPTSFRTKL